MILPYTKNSLTQSILAFLIMLFSAKVSATPVYLGCSVSSEEETNEFSVTIDEDTKKITHIDKNGITFNSDGFFSANEISYQLVKPGIITIKKLYKIDRTSLFMTYRFLLESEVSNTEIISKGSCNIINTSERKI